MPGYETIIKEQLFSNSVKARISRLSLEDTINYQLDIQLSAIKRFILSTFSGRTSCVKLYIDSLDIHTDNEVSTIRLSDDTENYSINLFLNLSYIDRCTAKLDRDSITELLTTCLSARGYFATLSMLGSGYKILISRNRKQYIKSKLKEYINDVTLGIYILYIVIGALCIAVSGLFVHYTIHTILYPTLAVIFFPIILFPVIELIAILTIQSGIAEYDTSIPDIVTNDTINALSLDAREDIEQWLHS